MGKKKVSLSIWTALLVSLSLLGSGDIASLFAQYGSINNTQTRQPAQITSASSSSYLAPGNLVYSPNTASAYIAQNTSAVSSTSLPGLSSVNSPANSGPVGQAIVYPPSGTTVVGPATIVPAPTNAPFDPYASPQKKGIFDSLNTDYQTVVPETYKKIKRFCDQASLNYTLIGGGNGYKDMMVNDLEARLQFAVPCRWLPSSTSVGSETSYLYIAPGAEFSWWDQANSDVLALFGAYCDFGMRPQLTKDFLLDAWIRVGVFSDYEKVTSKSWRVQGRVMALFPFATNWQGTLGVMYLDRNRVKLLPSGGLIWTPTSDWILKLTFPDPMISKRLPVTGAREWWVYLMGDYGGGTWTIRDDYDGKSYRTDYNDIRVAVGIRCDNPSCLSGFAEVGGAFGREIVGIPGAHKLNNAVYFRIGLTY